MMGLVERAIASFKARFSPRQRAVVLALAAVEFGMKVAAARDIDRRSSQELRASKLFWRLVLLVNTLGPLGYFRWGRRP
jgi:hypothetical protein